MSASLSTVPFDHEAARAAWRGVTDGSIASLSVRFSIDISSDAELTIQRVLTDSVGATIASEKILSHPVDGPEAGELLLVAIDRLSPHAAVVGRATMLAGERWFSARVGAIARVLSAERSAEVERSRAAAEAADRLHSHIDVFFRGKRDTVLDLQRGDAREPFWTITFSERWERDRFWDWLRWQRNRFGDFADAASSEGALALRGALLREMLEAERAANTAGLATAGRRPLRFWCGSFA